MSKLKILMCSEASFLSSGFATYTREILNRLYATNKYEIAEFASYSHVNDPRDKDIPWRLYANAVRDEDPRHKEYSARPDNAFGRWRFDKVVVDFKPDVVIDIRDYWMSSYQELSPCRPYFHWILMPTIDSSPQQQLWMDTYLSADAVFTYSDWGANVLKEQSSNNVNYIDTASPGVDLNTFRVKDVQQCKTSLGVDENSVIIGSVMRNQKRKLIPRLCGAFRKLLDQYETNNNSTGKNLYLYLHTSWPDAGWDIPEVLKENRLLNKVLFTYVCKSCNDVSAQVFSGPSIVCTKCLNKTKVFPSVSSGISTEQLSTIYNTFSLYIQYAICEGFGMPQVEAAACGVPVATVNYSAMCDIINKIKAYPIKVDTEFKELETRAIRVYPDNDDLIQTINKVLNLPQSMIDKKRKKTRELTEKFYDWDIIAKKWENYLDSLVDNRYHTDWSKIQQLETLDNIADIDTSQNIDQMLLMCHRGLGDIEKISSSRMLHFLNDIDNGFQLQGLQTKPIDINTIINQINTYVKNNNELKFAIDNNIEFNDDFIQYARLKSQ
jgi:glycosyltransferase involved in cell wall biosynthesis